MDLGLSVKWASCNLGGEKPEDAGDGYAWGETTTKGNYSWESYKYFKERSKENGNPIMTKYVYTQCGYSAYSGDRDGRGTLEPEDDAAHVVLGDDWRMPTFGELQELYKKAKWETFKTDDGKECYRITGPNGNSIVLNQEDIWTSSTSNDCAQYNAMSLHSVKMNGCTVSERRAPYKIRPVKP